MEEVRDAYLHQHVTVATRFRVGQRTSTLDLILTNEENLVDNLEVHSPLGNSDHGCLKFHLICCRERKVQPWKMYFYDEGNYSSMKDELAGAAWDTLLTEAEGDPDTMYDIFCKKILEFQECHVPTSTINGPSKHIAYKRAQKELGRNICGNLKDNPKRPGPGSKRRYPTSRD